MSTALRHFERFPLAVEFLTSPIEEDLDAVVLITCRVQEGNIGWAKYEAEQRLAIEYPAFSSSRR